MGGGGSSPHNYFCPPKEEVFLVEMLTYPIKNRYTLSGFWVFGLAKNDVTHKNWSEQKWSHLKEFTTSLSK